MAPPGKQLLLVIAIALFACRAHVIREPWTPIPPKPPRVEPPARTLADVTPPGSSTGWDRFSAALQTHDVNALAREKLEPCTVHQSATSACVDRHEGDMRYQIAAAREILYSADATPPAERSFRAWGLFHDAVASIHDLCVEELRPYFAAYVIKRIDSELRTFVAESYKDPSLSNVALSSYEMALATEAVAPVTDEVAAACVESAIEARRGKWVAKVRAKE